MKLDTPITFTPPPITMPDGEVREHNPVTLHVLDITVYDNELRKTALAYIRPCPQPLVLWSDDAYTEIGDYTQEQVDARVVELLGADPAATLLSLFSAPAQNS